ncbi:calcium-binding protein [Rhizobium leguminosarum]|uniref:calcium-binding protein n=1 Tax=Rhizobium leguminosarum TaxID=384 RepID=UPI000DE51F92|nr:calcium-binding protein [Rhizobium leguminosarum]MBY2918281.1 calcium-binding protein [Rhizobium leguminosarum]MBY2973768.1 calcium-binding protein [Rhizobium leguminosarum]MBY2981168.1 calcium-binding protein [Rhizobium leguminosarum]MBY3002685.1 calcium-binding protein [Rhizobium leguminosarum]MBY3009718.1 calcium-binding protein [Rhizobium leguminosarum]
MAQAVRINDIIRSFGIDTHIDYTDGKYSNVGEVVKALNYLGLDTVRDHAPNSASDPNGQTHLGDAAEAGVQFVFSAQREVDPATVAQRLHSFVQAHPGSVVGIEGPNEVNNWPVSYHGLSGQAAAVAYQKDLSADVNADPLLKNIPVLGFTGYTVASASDYTTIHTYAKDGDQPYSWLSRESGVQRAADPGKPLAITETGYHTSLTADTNGGWEGVSEATQAKLLLNTLMDGAALGSKQTFIYELLDAYSDPQGTNQEKHFGLFHLDYSAKPAATAIHNLTEILADDGAAKASFSAGTLDYSIDGLPSSARSLLTEKSDGSYQIIVWNEPDIWSQSSDTAIQATTTAVKVNLGASFGSVKVFDPVTGTTAVKSLSNVSSLTLDVVDHPVIIEVAGTGASTPPPATNHLYGGTGNDTFTVTNANQIVDESRGGGTDTVKASISFSLADQKHTVGTIENLTLTGTANLSATGNNTANILTGNDGNNSLNGAKGNDRLIGGLGNDKLIGKAGADVLTGGSGGDSFVFDVKPDNTSVDKIRDFSSAAGDKLMLDHSIFAELSLSGFSDENFVLGRKALEADDKLIYDRASGILSYDADGSAAGVAIHVADLDNSAALHFKDFMLI